LDEDCDGGEDCTEFIPVPSRRWRWLDACIALCDFFAGSAFAFAQALATVNDAMRAHYNWQVDQRRYENLAELDTISLTEE
jgi:hypothetical protein